MVITENTKISDLIKANPASIDAISSINKHFKKLKNPILRRTLARRVTIADAAKIGGVSVAVFFEKLAAVGFVYENKELDPEPTVTEEPDNSITGSEETMELDVRPVIEGGDDPFQLIMKTIKSIPEGGVLKVINSFEPIPLINILKEDGYQSKVTRPEKGVVHTFFKKGKAVSVVKKKEDKPLVVHDFDQKLQKFCERLNTIDVRPLEMPEPMVKILTELETLPKDQALFVHHKKFPKYLIPELKTRGYQLVEKRIDDHNIDLLIFKEV
jgi:uncharacterized protein (DUF2249 family)